MDIVICTTDEILAHKKGEIEESLYFYWHMGRVPRNFNVDDKIFFATRGKLKKATVKGYFVCEDFNPQEEETIVWHKDSWTSIGEIEIDSFRGFRYRNFDY